MKVLVATKETQGKRENDFCFVPEGEIVHFSIKCDNKNCGCDRSMAGVLNHKSTTTMKVIDQKDLNPIKLTQDIADSFENEDWAKFGREEVERIAMSEVLDLVIVTSQFKVGAIVEVKDDEFSERL